MSTPDTDDAKPAIGGEIVLLLDGKQYRVPGDPKRIPAKHLVAVEQATGMMLGDFSTKLLDPRGSAMAWIALAWIAKRMAGEFVKWDDFDVDMESLASVIESVARARAEQPADAT